MWYNKNLWLFKEVEIVQQSFSKTTNALLKHDLPETLTTLQIANASKNYLNWQIQKTWDAKYIKKII